MTSIEEIKKTRLKKLDRLKKAGINPYPAETNRTHSCQKALAEFSKLSKNKRKIVLAGRIRSIRAHGKSTFIHLEDNTDKIQAYLKEDVLGKKKYQLFENFDIGDFIEVKGNLFKTKKGEITLKVADYRIITKSLLPLPEKWHGLKDVEVRFRKRYLDLIMNKEVREKFEKRSQIIKEIRNFLETKDFMEVETPILQLIPGGAAANPFKTHHRALNVDLYLRIAPELYLKRLLVGGFEKVYEIGRCFRNEGIDYEHNPDFTMLEFYWAMADYKDLMKLTEEMFKHIVKKTFGKLIIEYQGKKINFKTPWRKIGYKSIKKPEKEAFAKIIQPTFIVHHPTKISPLAKSLPNQPDKAARFQLIAGGIELVNAFTELNDPLEQKNRFKEQEKQRKKGDEEAQRYDADFIEALEYGMPPAAGFGLGVDRLVALLTDSHSLREVILFPTMRPK